MWNMGLTKASEKLANTFVRRILKRIIIEKYHHEFYQLFDDSEISKTIKIRKFQLTGHVHCKEETYILKRVSELKTGRRRICQYRLRPSHWHSITSQIEETFLSFLWRFGTFKQSSVTLTRCSYIFDLNHKKGLNDWLDSDCKLVIERKDAAFSAS